uniref:Phospholipid/glycerol acyltransferase domain-containing protein n=1 Tax=Phaeomonas parva TaxID=124430 RepID=A0A6U4LPK4_9STRA|mmetsp:Transcript_9667/g.28370  ORF Transcript_9667/g.28370 Transcript_9667/m.28370 type:complete len:463 (+) Transcript_9667:260-1648(+)|eukprot:CAMPEP_0118853170 /NCGR_PEP_ID=MMETSP1163-20130328/1859_1 /TAXON_ID=124430 /ORGANISM="Phaeomonas parva, Strain CCMP2877" /LENGTH=462 /DNA_ID=CAMNT_0006785673 /DNA_START=227 /DNA_END=1615 /DNA_ORIENTATION=+
MGVLYPVKEIWRRFWVYSGLTVMTIVALINFLMLLAILPVKYLVSETFYRRFTSILLHFSVPGFLCVPFSWCGCRVRCQGLGYLREYAEKNAVILSNHSARIDWVIGLFIGTCYYSRVGFVTEAFVLLLPIVGWFRMLCEDMFVFRSFKRDKIRLEENINGFHASNVKRWVFLSPEGMICDFSDFDKKYIRDCRDFCKSRGLSPFEMCLTPRYKGITCFNKIVSNGVDEPAQNISVTMTYTQDGERLVKPLSDDTRVIPDLWTILSGGLDVDVHLHMLELSNDPEVMKDQLMNDYAMKDKLLKHFWEKGRYPAEHPVLKKAPKGWAVYHDQAAGEPDAGHGPYQTVPVPHWRMNLSVIAQMLLMVAAFRLSGLSVMLSTVVFLIWSAIATSHILGQLLANGQSRESLPFEGCTKALMFRMNGREGAKAEPEALPLGTEEKVPQDPRLSCQIPCVAAADKKGE